MLQNAYFLAKIGADTAEIERNFAKNWQLPYWARLAAEKAQLALQLKQARRPSPVSPEARAGPLGFG